MTKQMARCWMTALLTAYLALGVAYSVVNPLFESPDEALNYANIRYLIEERRLPVLEPGKPTKAHHPPLYYLLGALLTFWVPDEHFDAVVERINPFWAYRMWEPGVDNKSRYLHDPALEAFPYRDVALGVHLIRWLSLLMGAGTLLLVYATACEVIAAVYGNRGSVPTRALAIGATATVPVPLTEDAAAPAALRLDIGLYPYGGPRLPTADGQDTVSLGPVRLAAREPVSPTGLPLSYRLGEGVQLVAWKPDWSGPVHPGGLLLFTLYWACDVPPGRPLNVFVHLVGEGFTPLAQGNGPPMGGNYPTHLWYSGDVIADPRAVTLPADLPPGHYRLLVGLYSLETGERLPAYGADGARLPNDAIPLAEVEVRP